jgi:hypothetical protein
MEGPTAFPALLSPFIDSGHARINYSKGKIDFWNGAAIHLCHCQYEKDVFKYQGAEIHVLLIDELTHFTDKIYRFLRGRCRLGGLDLPKEYHGKFPVIINGANPGGIGHNWVKKTFINNCKPMEIRQMSKADGGMRRQYIPARLEDNPTLMENDPDYADRLEGLGNPALVRAMRKGDWNIVSGGMVDDLWDDKVHILKPFAIPPSWAIDRSMDWGSSKPFSIGYWATSDGTPVLLMDGKTRTFPRNTKIRIAEWYGCTANANEGLKLPAREVAREMKVREQAFEWGKRIKDGPADSSIFDTDNEISIADDFKKEGIKWLAADKRPGSRVNGANQIRTLLKAAVTNPKEEAGLYVFDCCRAFIDQIPVIPRDENKTDDVDTDAEDHIWDETRYQVARKQQQAKIYEL